MINKQTDCEAQRTNGRGYEAKGQTNSLKSKVKRAFIGAFKSTYNKNNILENNLKSLDDVDENFS